jgi:hypothetical protein
MIAILDSSAVLRRTEAATRDGPVVEDLPISGSSEDLFSWDALAQAIASIL